LASGTRRPTARPAVSSRRTYTTSAWASCGRDRGCCKTRCSAHPKGSNPTWYWLVKVKTNAKGQFVATFKDPVSATWQAVFEGNNSNGVGHLSYGSPEVYVRLK